MACKGPPGTNEGNDEEQKREKRCEENEEEEQKFDIVASELLFQLDYRSRLKFSVSLHPLVGHQESWLVLAVRVVLAVLC